MSYYAVPGLYDLMYGDFRADIGFHVAEASAAGGPVLELCCGNGRVLMPMLEAGVEADGLDVDETMLGDLGAKLRQRGLHAKLECGDMRDFALGRRYALVIVAFNAFYHNLTQADQIATLRCCLRHLAPGGRLSLIVYHPSAEMLAGFDGTRKPWKEVADGAGTARISQAVSVDRVEQLQHIRRTIERVDGVGRVTETHRLDVRLRYAGKPEMELLLRTAGFGRWSVVTPFDRYESARHYDPPRPAEDGAPLAWSAWAA